MGQNGGMEIAQPSQPPVAAGIPQDENQLSQRVPLLFRTRHTNTRTQVRCGPAVAFKRTPHGSLNRLIN